MTEKKIGLYGRILAEAEQLGKDTGHATGPSVPIVSPPHSEYLGDGYGKYNEVPCSVCQAYPNEPCVEGGKPLGSVVHAARMERFRIEKHPTYMASDDVRHQWRRVACPRCRAMSYMDCTDEAGRTVAGLIHDDRKVWSTDPRSEEMPYRRWPWADEIERWGVFKRKSNGDPYKRQTRDFNTYEKAKDSADGLEEASKLEHPDDFMKQQRYTVAPLVKSAFAPGTSAWLREDLAQERDPRNVDCPHCGAQPGSPCKRPSGHEVFGGDYHADRKRKAAS